MLNRITAAALLALCAVSAGAATSESTLTVDATVAHACVIGDAIMSFGGVSIVTNAAGATSTPAADSSTQVPVTCTNGTAATIEAGLGLNASGSTRRMTQLLNTSAFLPYQLYRDAARTQVFSTGANAINYTGTGTADLVTIYGRITGPGVDSALPGIYTDSVALVLTYTP